MATTATSNGSSKDDTSCSIPRLQDYYISEMTGFLMEDPLLELPEYFEAWNNIGRHLVELLTARKLRDEVHEMELLDHSRLSGHRQWRLAYTILSFVGHGYVWQDGTRGASKLAVPWYEVSRHLDMPAVTCQPNAVLSNWRLIDPGKCVLPAFVSWILWFIDFYKDLTLEAEKLGL